MNHLADMNCQRFQASLGGKPKVMDTEMRDAVHAGGLRLVRVNDVDYVGHRVLVNCSDGSTWARVLKRHESGNAAGESRLPNIGDFGVVGALNGDSKSLVWLGSLNSITTANTVEADSNYVSDDMLIRRDYKKHETGTFWLLDKLGNYVVNFFKKSAKEADPAKKNLDISIGKDGSLNITHYRGADKKSLVFNLNQAGYAALTIYRDDGVKEAVTFKAYGDDTNKGTVVIENDAHQISMISKTGAEIFRYLHKKKAVTAQITEVGDATMTVNGSVIEMDQDSGDIFINHKSGSYVSVEQDSIEMETQDGSSVLLYKDTAQMFLTTGQSVFIDGASDVMELTAGSINVDCDEVQLGSGPIQQPLLNSGFIVQYNLLVAQYNLLVTHHNTMLALLKSHVHPTLGSTSPTLVNPTTGLLSPAVPAELPAIPVVPTPVTNMTQMVTGA